MYLNQIRSTDITDALNWHIWINNNNLIIYIVGAKSFDKYKKELSECKFNVKHYMPLALRNKYLSSKQKISIILATLMPVLNARRVLRKIKIAFDRDYEV
jgi:hypothetical protein